MNLNSYMRFFDTRKFLRLTLLAAGLALMTNVALAADKPIDFKLATVAPKGSSYHQNLMEMGEKWRAISGGGVKLTIFTDGTQGSEVLKQVAQLAAHAGDEIKAILESKE